MVSQVNSNNQAVGISKPQKIKNKGIVKAYLTGQLMSVPVSLAGFGLLKGMRKISQLSTDEFSQLTKAAEQGLKSSGLKAKGVKIFRFKDIPNFLEVLKSKNFKSLKELLKASSFTEKKAIVSLRKELAGNKRFLKIVSKFPKDLQKKILTGQASFLSSIFKLGGNACYMSHTNKIITPTNHLATSVFHEIGHALNANGGKALKYLQKMRPLAQFAAPIILLVALLNKRKTTDEKSNSKVQNVFDTIKKNAGKLTALAFAPMVVEEGIASLRGGALAKALTKQGLLSKQVLNKVKITNAFGFASYVLAAVATGLITMATVKVKDKFQAKYEQKLQAKNNIQTNS